MPEATETPARFRAAGGWIAYTRSGSGPPVVLIHGLGCSRRTWHRVASRLAQTHTVIAVDLPGHGESDPPDGDFSPGAHAAAIRDLLDHVGLHRVDLVGHSLGGGIAMAFAHLFPDRTRTMTLISSGGFGREVTVMLRAATVPGAEEALTLISHLPVGVQRLGLSALSRLPGVLSPFDVDSLGASLADLRSPATRSSFVRTARTVLDLYGQSVSAQNHLPMLAGRPVLLIWGGDDRTIPPSHHRRLAARLPSARTLEIPEAGHFPQETAPTLVVLAIEDLLAAPG